jgi:nitrite reductase/ring-hydroxylating ferredoxin subunit/uncharacterized membrane protein
MRSTASFRGHPIHPALIPFPIAFLVGALLFDAAGRLFDRPALWEAGAYLTLAGIAAGLLAALPGALDYLRTVPPESSGRKRATRHALANVSALVLFGLALWVRGSVTAPPVSLSLLLQLAGAGLLGVGGWMGGTLVFRNQIGVDHRYAGAGKWREERLEARPGQAILVAGRDELERDQMKLLHVNGRRIVLARTEDGYTAFDDRCTHRGASLADGVMICGTVQCPWHGSQFDVRSGAVRAGPAADGIRTYEVREEGGEVRIGV